MLIRIQIQQVTNGYVIAIETNNGVEGNTEVKVAATISEMKAIASDAMKQYVVAVGKTNE